MERTINLRNIPDDLFRKFKKMCVDNNTDMTTTLKNLMKLYVKNGHLDLTSEEAIAPSNASRKVRKSDSMSLPRKG